MSARSAPARRQPASSPPPIFLLSQAICEGREAVAQRGRDRAGGQKGQRGGEKHGAHGEVFQPGFVEATLSRTRARLSRAAQEIPHPLQRALDVFQRIRVGEAQIPFAVNAEIGAADGRYARILEQG